MLSSSSPSHSAIGMKAETFRYKAQVQYEYLRVRVREELALLKLTRVWLVIVLTGLVQFIHNVSHNYVHFLAGKYRVFGGSEKRLVDFGFKFFESFLPPLPWVPDTMLHLSAVLAGVIVVSPLFTPYLVGDAKTHSVQIAFRACIVCSTAVCMRIISFFITLLPSPANHCAEEVFVSPMTTSEFFFHFDTGRGCSDLIFSSHMLYGLIAVLTVTHYCSVGEKNAWTGKWGHQRVVQAGIVGVAWFLVLFEAVAIVRQKAHYSIDVFGALTVVPLLWVVGLYLFPTDPVVACFAAENVGDIEEEEKVALVSHVI